VDDSAIPEAGEAERGKRRRIAEDTQGVEARA
jgi:hypothetical protein